VIEAVVVLSLRLSASSYTVDMSCFPPLFVAAGRYTPALLAMFPTPDFLAHFFLVAPALVVVETKPNKHKNSACVAFTPVPCQITFEKLPRRLGLLSPSNMFLYTRFLSCFIVGKPDHSTTRVHQITDHGQQEKGTFDGGKGNPC
jgi:hypothetical protein